MFVFLFSWILHLISLSLLLWSHETDSPFFSSLCLFRLFPILKHLWNIIRSISSIDCDFKRSWRIWLFIPRRFQASFLVDWTDVKNRVSVAHRFPLTPLLPLLWSEQCLFSSCYFTCSTWLPLSTLLGINGGLTMESRVRNCSFITIHYQWMNWI